MVKLKEHKWKPVELDASVFTGNCEGLIGIEELTEYDLDEFKEGSNKIITVSTSVHKRTKKSKQKQKGGESKQLIQSKQITDQNRNHTSEIEEHLSSDRLITVDSSAQSKIKKRKKKQKDGEKKALLMCKQITEETGNQPSELEEHLGTDRITTDASSAQKDAKKRKKKQKGNRNKKPKVHNQITNKNESQSPETKKYTQSEGNIKKGKRKSSTKKKKRSITVENKNNEQFDPKKSDVSYTEYGKVDENESDMIPWNLIGVPKLVTKALIDQGFKEPTEIQRLAIPPAIMGRRDILGAAETGSGKTLAFGIPIIHGILKNLEKEEKVNDIPVEQPNDSMSESDIDDTEMEGIGCVRVINLKSDDTAKIPRRNKLWALVLTPTRELAIQIKNHLTAALKYIDLKVAVIIGGMSVEKQERLLKGQPHIVVATPGRLWEMISQGEPHLSSIEDIRFLAIDETDRMTEVNHFPELRSLLERINVDLSKKKLRQNFVFSATLTLVHEPPKYLTQNKKRKNKKNAKKLTVEGKLKSLIDILGITDPKIIDVTKKTGITQLLTESAIVCSFEEKDYYLYYFLLRHPGRTLVFCNSISCVRRLASLLNLLNCQPLPLHANMLQKQRLKNLDRFRDRSTGLLLATDVAARGLDIPKVEHVIHYQVPRTSESYIHRSGRTARANHEGLTLLLVDPSEGHLYTKLLKTLKRDKELPVFPVTELVMNSVKQRVNLAREVDQLQLSYKKTNSTVGWLQKAAQEMDILLDNDELPEKMDNKKSSGLQKQINVKKKQLSVLLSAAVTPRGFSYKYPTLNRSVKTTASTFCTTSAIQAVKDANKTETKKKGFAGTKKIKMKKKKKRFY